VRVDERLSPWVVDEIRAAIADAGGNEVFLVGRVGDDGRVETVKVGARGNEEAVPMLSPHLSEGDVVLHNHPSAGSRAEHGGRPSAGSRAEHGGRPSAGSRAEHGGRPSAGSRAEHGGRQDSIIRPSEADLGVASRLGNQGIGFYILDNDVTEIYVVAEPVKARQIESLAEEKLAALLAPGGALSRIYPLFEERESQVGMLRQVCRAFNNEEISAAEAGTGVGKSLAYLLPAVAWAVHNGERVVVSTNTINLQQQLMEKDIPLAKKVLGEEPKVVLVKGRGNYLCMHRLGEALEEMSLFEERDQDLLAIREWARTTESGSRTDLSFYPPEETWSKVCSEADACLGLRCAYREGCYVLKARREASTAQILIANHHLLFADLAFRLAGPGFDDPAVLPPFRRLIFDEAHNMEKAATSFFSKSFSRFQILRFTGRLYRKRKGRITGHFPLLARSLDRGDIVRMIPKLIGEILERAEEADTAVLGMLGNESSLLLDSGTMPDFRESAGDALGNLSFAIRELSKAFAEVFEMLETKGTSESPGSLQETLVWDCRVQVSRLEGIADICDRFRGGEMAANDIFWLESVRSSRARAEEQDRTVRFTITPLDVGPLMREAVFTPIKTVVMTSATLTVTGDFSFWAGRIGLREEREKVPVFHSFPSPFNYREHVLLGVPTDAPAPDLPDHQGFIVKFLDKTLRASHGAGLVLFTSYQLMRDTHAALQPAMARAGIRLMKQGDDDRARLLDAFKAERSSVLFATDSFWEGVDAPGETLQVVVLCRLPFRVPSEPVLRARMAAIEARGGNPFSELSLPDAVVRMRQGFGRLMRRHDDTGVVLILDPRVVTKRYGSVFLESLPATQRSIAPASEVLKAVAGFFGQ
jgi:ATP-dependent DNA helicase DinG